MWQRIADLLAGRTRAQREGKEPDVEPDPAQANARQTGGRSDPDASGSDSTTGTSEDDNFVGRVAGEDAIDAASTGAGARAQAHGRHGEPSAS
jgi:hypothetical protein